MTQFGWEENSVECASVSVPLTTDSLDRLCKLAAKLDRSPTDLAREAFEKGLGVMEAPEYCRRVPPRRPDHAPK